MRDENTKFKVHKNQKKTENLTWLSVVVTIFVSEFWIQN